MNLARITELRMRSVTIFGWLFIMYKYIKENGEIIDNALRKKNFTFKYIKECIS